MERQIATEPPIFCEHCGNLNEFVYYKEEGSGVSWCTDCADSIDRLTPAQRKQDDYDELVTALAWHEFERARIINELEEFWP